MEPLTLLVTDKEPLIVELASAMTPLRAINSKGILLVPQFTIPKVRVYYKYYYIKVATDLIVHPDVFVWILN